MAKYNPSVTSLIEVLSSITAPLATFGSERDIQEERDREMDKEKVGRYTRERRIAMREQMLPYQLTSYFSELWLSFQRHPHGWY